MMEPNLYRILNVSPSAGADEIKAAYRELVKKYHPDLFATSAEKTRATVKFRQINDAYAVLGDPGRRREYDEKRGQQATPKRSQPPPRRRPPQAKARRPRPAKPGALFAKLWSAPVNSKLAGGILGVMLLAFIADAAWKKPQLVAAWALLEDTVVEPNASGRKRAAPKWSDRGRYGSRAQCVAALRKLIEQDEKSGGHAILDERNGTIGMTVRLKDEATLAQELFQERLKQFAGAASAEEQRRLKEQAREDARQDIKQNGIGKQVRNLECRETKVIDSPSWLRRILMSAGLVR